MKWAFHIDFLRKFDTFPSYYRDFLNEFFNAIPSAVFIPGSSDEDDELLHSITKTIKRLHKAEELEAECDVILTPSENLKEFAGCKRVKTVTWASKGALKESYDTNLVLCNVLPDETNIDLANNFHFLPAGSFASIKPDESAKATLVIYSEDEELEERLELLELFKELEDFNIVSISQLNELNLIEAYNLFQNSKRCLSLIDDINYNDWCCSICNKLGNNFVMTREDGSSPFRYIAFDRKHPFLKDIAKEKEKKLHSYGSYSERLRQIFKELGKKHKTQSSANKINSIIKEIEQKLGQEVSACSSSDNLSLLDKIYNSQANEKFLFKVKGENSSFPLEKWIQNDKAANALLDFLKTSAKNEVRDRYFLLFAFFVVSHMAQARWINFFKELGNQVEDFQEAMKQVVLRLFQIKASKSLFANFMFTLHEASYKMNFSKKEREEFLHRALIDSDAAVDISDSTKAYKSLFLAELGQYDEALECIERTYRETENSEGLGASIALPLLNSVKMALFDKVFAEQHKLVVADKLKFCLRALELDEKENKVNTQLDYYIKPIASLILGLEDEFKQAIARQINRIKYRGVSSLLCLDLLLSRFDVDVKSIFEQESLENVSRNPKFLHDYALCALILKDHSAKSHFELLKEKHSAYFNDFKYELTKWGKQALANKICGMPYEQLLHLDKNFSNASEYTELYFNNINTVADYNIPDFEFSGVES